MGKKAKDKARQKASRKQHKKAAAEQPGAEPTPIPDGAAAQHLKGTGDLDDQPERPPVESAAELASRLVNVSTVLQRQLGHRASDDGLTRARLSALALLVLGGPRTLGALAAAEHVRPPTMTRLVHAMEADGLVAREVHPSDGRSVIIRATPKGERELVRGRSRQVAPLAASITGLSRAERSQLAEASDLLGQVLREMAWESSEPSE